MKIIGILFILMNTIITGTLDDGRASSDERSALVTFSLIGCQGSLRNFPTIGYYNAGSNILVNEARPVKSLLSSGLVVTSLELPAGYNKIDFSTSQCYANIGVQVLPKEQRHLAIQMIKWSKLPTDSGHQEVQTNSQPSDGRTRPAITYNNVYEPCNSLAGHLPLSGLNVFYYSIDARGVKEGSRQPAYVEVEAYYVDSLEYSGDYVLEIESANLDVRIPVNVPGCNTVHDIRLSDINKSYASP